MEIDHVGSMRDKHLVCAFCGTAIDVPDAFEHEEVERTVGPDGTRRVVHRTVRRQDIAGTSRAVPPGANSATDRPDEVFDAIRSHIGSDGSVRDPEAMMEAVRRRLGEIAPGAKITEHRTVTTTTRQFPSRESPGPTRVVFLQSGGRVVDVGLVT
ncbi:MAG: hypothetical protein L0227_07505, partial [Chloroflexi bacterium]|nr:hypothetical protein [Chloroflexota bacterium]